MRMQYGIACWLFNGIYVGGHGIYRVLLLQRKNAQENTQFRNNNLGPNILFGHCSDRVKRKEFYVQYGVTSGIPFFDIHRFDKRQPV